MSAGPEVRWAQLAAGRAPSLVSVKALAKAVRQQFCYQWRVPTKKNVVEEATCEGAPFMGTSVPHMDLPVKGHRASLKSPLP